MTFRWFLWELGKRVRIGFHSRSGSGGSYRFCPQVVPDRATGSPPEDREDREVCRSFKRDVQRRPDGKLENPQDMRKLTVVVEIVVR